MSSLPPLQMVIRLFALQLAFTGVRPLMFNILFEVLGILCISANEDMRRCLKLNALSASHSCVRASLNARDTMSVRQIPRMPYCEKCILPEVNPRLRKLSRGIRRRGRGKMQRGEDDENERTNERTRKFDAAVKSR